MKTILISAALATAVAMPAAADEKPTMEESVTYTTRALFFDASCDENNGQDAIIKALFTFLATASLSEFTSDEQQVIMTRGIEGKWELINGDLGIEAQCEMLTADASQLLKKIVTDW